MPTPTSETAVFINEIPISPRVLLVDDNDLVLTTLNVILERSGFLVTVASSVNQALKLIAAEPFDILLSDLHMPDAGDGLTVVSAMRHFNPKAVTMIFSGFPEMEQAAAAILLQADEILIKPMAPAALVEAIKKRLRLGSSIETRLIHTVADILQQDTEATIQNWLQRVERVPEIITVPLSPEARAAHLPELFRELVVQLRSTLPLGSRPVRSTAAVFHGALRCDQGYTAAMLVEESRMLQVSIFQTLQNNLHQVDFSLLLLGVMTIADEVDSQLAEALKGYIAEAGMSHTH